MIKMAVVCVSDRSFQGVRDDLSGKAISEALADICQTEEYVIVPDEKSQIEEALKNLCEKNLTLIITTGGTGFAPRDVTPEATLAVAEKLAPGISEALRFESMKYTPNAMLSRGTSVIRKGTLIINFPGSPKACKECSQIIKPVLPHIESLLKGEVADCARQ